MPQLPRLAANLELQTLGDGYLVSETGSDWAHFLNRTAMLIILQCDGVTTPEQIALSLQELHGLDAPPVGDVEDILAQLAAQGVVLDSGEGERPGNATDTARMIRETAHA